MKSISNKENGNNSCTPVLFTTTFVETKNLNKAIQAPHRSPRFKTTPLSVGNGTQIESAIVLPQSDVITLARDLPNICSLFGLLSAVLGIYFAIEGNFQLAIIGVLWSVLFDWLDGIIARKMKKRTAEQGVFGGQLDSMIDIISFGVLPAVLLLSYGNYSIWFVPGAFVIIATCAIRLSYFNLHGLINSRTYKGLALDNNVLILAFSFIFESFFEHDTFSLLFYSIMMALCVLNLSSLSTPKLGGNWVYVLLSYVLLLTLFFGSTLYFEV